MKRFTGEQSYYRRVIRTGKDHRIPNPTHTERWQIHVRSSILGAQVVWARRNGRGPQLRDRSQWPPELVTFLACDNRTRTLEDFIPHGELGWNYLVQNGDATWQPRKTRNGHAQGYVTINVPKYQPAAYRKLVRANARQNLAQMEIAR